MPTRGGHPGGARGGTAPPLFENFPIELDFGEILIDFTHDKDKLEINSVITNETRNPPL